MFLTSSISQINLAASTSIGPHVALSTFNFNLGIFRWGWREKRENVRAIAESRLRHKSCGHYIIEWPVPVRDRVEVGDGAGAGDGDGDSLSG